MRFSNRIGTVCWLALLIVGNAVIANVRGEDLPKADKVIEGMKHQAGFFTVHQKSGEVLIEVPKSELEKEFFLATTFAGGNSFHAWQWSDTLVSWQRFEKQVLLIEKEVRYRADPKSPIGEPVHRTYSDRIVLALPIVGEGKGLIVDGKVWLAKNAAKFFGPSVARLDPRLARFGPIKNFPHNLEIAVTMPDRSDGKLVTLHYSIAKLPKSEYKPRLADDRVGYFITAIKDFTKGRVSDDRFIRYVNRWDLQKTDPSLKLSPPKKPIVFYIEKTVPIKFRRYVREGILAWNQAFEKIGFDRAIEVRQQTKDNEFSDLDPEDSRYNFFRWITSEQAFAMAPMRVNPYTGEVLDADIVFDDSMARFYLSSYNIMYRDIAAMFSPRLRQYFRDFPEEHPLAGTGFERFIEVDGDSTGLEAEANRRSVCQYGRGLLHQLALSSVARVAMGFDFDFNEIPEEFVGPVIRETVMHESGHTLGLRHNFKASTWKTMDDVTKSPVDSATVGSVMDYNAINVATEGEQKAFITGNIGPYDYWAIEYGYSPNKAEKDLREIASRGARDGLHYGTDEDLFVGDPTINQFDLSSEPLDFCKSRVVLVTKIWKQLMTSRVVQDGDSYQTVRRVFDMLMYELSSASSYAAKYIGGAYVNRDHKGDECARSPLVVVPAAKQRAALRFLCEQVFADNERLDPGLLSHLAAGRWSHWGSHDDLEELNYPILERVLSVQSMALSMLLNPETFTRLRNSALKVEPGVDVLTIPELFDTLTDSIFSELGRDGDVEITATRQNLQRNYIDRLIRMTLNHRSGPAIVQGIARNELSDVRTRLEKAHAKEPYTRAHLEDSLRRTTKALDANYSATD